MSTEEKFAAAVNVIQNLPKDGAFQPSQDLQLKFYALFKQATIGRNTKPKPSFYNIVERAKWSAWSALKDMSKEEAMVSYVNQLKEVVETMSFDANVESFMEALGNDDFEMLFGPIVDQSSTNSEASLSQTPNTTIGSPRDLNALIPPLSSQQLWTLEPGMFTAPAFESGGGSISDEEEFEDSMQGPSNDSLDPRSLKIIESLIQPLRETVECLEQSIQALPKESNINALHKMVTLLQNEVEGQKHVYATQGKRLYYLVAFLVVWPILVNLVMSRIKRHL